MNDNREFFDILCKNINFIISDDIVFCGGTFDIINEKTLNDTYTNRLYYNSKLVKLRNTKINYNCISCNNKNIEILLKRFLTKKTSKCRICKEYDKNKRMNLKKKIIKK